MPANCPDHGLTAEGHCEEMEKMLEEVPGDFCEGEGDLPRHAVERLRLAYEEAIEERDGYRSALCDLAAASNGTTVSEAALAKSRDVLKNGPPVTPVTPSGSAGPR